jgi:hypothetical protein
VDSRFERGGTPKNITELVIAKSILKSVDKIANGSSEFAKARSKLEEAADLLREALQGTYDRHNEFAAARFAVWCVLLTVDCAATQASQYAAAVAEKAHDAALHSVGYLVAELDHAQRDDIQKLLVRAFRKNWDERVKAPSDIFFGSLSLNFPRDDSLESIPPSSVIPAREIASLPDHGLLAVASRQVLRILALLPEQFRGEAFEKISELQSTCAIGGGDPLLSLSNGFCELSDKIDRLLGGRATEAERSAVRAIYDLGRCTRCVWADAYDSADSFCRSALIFAEHSCKATGVLIAPDIVRDIETATVLASRMDRTRNSGRRQRKPFPQDIFAEYTAFDLETPIQGSSIFKICSLINEELIARLAENPAILHALDPRAFEELVGRIFDIYGFDVEVTAPVRDSGRDVIAISHDPVHAKYLIECKKYARTNKVGISIVQRLHGVLHGDRGTRAILATTSDFTTPAIEYMNRPHVQLEFEGRNFDGIHRWLVLADRISILRRTFNNEIDSDIIARVQSLSLPAITL